MKRRTYRLVLLFSLIVMMWLSGMPALLRSIRMNLIAIAVSHSVMSGQGCDVPRIVERLGSAEARSSPQSVRWRTICLVSAGSKAVRGRMWDEAIAYLEMAREADPLNVEVTELLAEAKYDGKGDWDGALTAFRQAIAARPATDVRGANDLRHKLGYLCLRAGRWQDAVRVYEEILYVSPTDAMAHALLGYVMYRGGRPIQEALDELQQAITLSPDNELGYRLLAQVYHSQGRYAEAEVMVQRAVTLAPQLVYLRHLWAEIVLAEGDAARAVEILTEATVRFPEDAYSYYLLASACRSVNDALGAIAAIERALTLDNTSNAWYWVTAGEIYESVGQLEKARSAYERVLSLDSADDAARDTAQSALAHLQ